MKSSAEPAALAHFGEAAFAPQRGSVRRRARLLAAVTAAVLVACAAAVGLRQVLPAAAPTVQPVPSVPAVVGLGYLEPTTSVVKIGAPTTSDGARIAFLLVDEGDMVEKGQPLCVLDTALHASAEVHAAQVQVALKRLLLDRQRLDTAYTAQTRQAALDRARAELQTLEPEYERQRSLLAGNVASRASYDKAVRDLRNAQATLAEMQAGLNRIQATIGATAGAAAPIDTAVAEQELAKAEADLAISQATLDQAVIHAPFAGRVLTLSARAGERIGSDGLLEMGGVGEMRAVIQIYETDIARVLVGQRVELSADALARPIGGVVQRIGATIRRQSVINNDPATTTDGRVVDVFVGLDQAASRDVASLSRLQVEARFAR